MVAAQREIREPARYRLNFGGPRGRGPPKFSRCTERAQGRLFKSRPEPARASPGGNFSTGAGAEGPGCRREAATVEKFPLWR